MLNTLGVIGFVVLIVHEGRGTFEERSAGASGSHGTTDAAPGEGLRDARGKDAAAAARSLPLSSSPLLASVEGTARFAARFGGGAVGAGHFRAVTVGGGGAGAGAAHDRDNRSRPLTLSSLGIGTSLGDAALAVTASRKRFA